MVDDMTIWMATGLHDVRWLPNVLSNFDRQTSIDKRLIIVENGEGIGSVPRSVPVDDLVVVLQSDKGPAQPMNAALKWLRELGATDDWFAKCDADDYYGPRYLESLAPAIRLRYDYTGRSRLYIRTTENRLWFAHGKPDQYVFHGPTLAGRVGSSVDFPIVKDWGEDALWCMAMHNQGRSCVTLAPEHFCYQRYANNDHAWPCSDRELRGAWGVEFEDLGTFDRDVVDGIKPRPRGTSLGTLGLDPDNFMPLRLLRGGQHAKA